MNDVHKTTEAVMQATKKPVTISCCKWDGTNTGRLAIEAAFPAMRTAAIGYKGDVVHYWDICTLEGSHRVSPGDYVIKGVKGEFYPCKPDIFAMTYDIGLPPADAESVDRLTPEKLAGYRDLVPMGSMVGVGGKALEVLLDEIDHWKAQAFRPLGDNHHNARLCPHCSPEPSGQLAEALALYQGAREGKAQMSKLCDELTYCLREIRPTLNTDDLKPFFVRLRDRIDAVLQQAAGCGHHQEPTPWGRFPETKREQL